MLTNWIPANSLAALNDGFVVAIMLRRPRRARRKPLLKSCGCLRHPRWRSQGSNSFSPTARRQNSSLFFIFELYVNEAGWAAHEATDHFKAAIKELLPRVTRRERVPLFPSCKSRPPSIPGTAERQTTGVARGARWRHAAAIGSPALKFLPFIAIIVLCVATACSARTKGRRPRARTPVSVRFPPIHGLPTRPTSRRGRSDVTPPSPGGAAGGDSSRPRRCASGVRHRRRRDRPGCGRHARIDARRELDPNGMIPAC